MRALLASVSSFRGITNPSEAAVCCRALQCCSDLLQSVEGQIRSFYPPLFWGNTYPSEAAQRCSVAVTCHSVLQCVLRICCLHFLFGLWILLRLACGVCVRVYAHTTLQYNTRRNNTATHHSTLQHAATCCNTNTFQRGHVCFIRPHVTNTRRNHTATHHSTLQLAAKRCNSLQNAATHNTIQRVHVSSSAMPHVTNTHKFSVMQGRGGACHVRMSHVTY